MCTKNSIINKKEALERIGDIEIYREIAQYFSLHLPGSIAALQDALLRGNLPEAMRLAHSLKGNCATMGADALREVCYSLEKLCRAGKGDAAQILFEKTVPELLALQQELLAI